MIRVFELHLRVNIGLNLCRPADFVKVSQGKPAPRLTPALNKFPMFSLNDRFLRLLSAGQELLRPSCNAPCGSPVNLRMRKTNPVS
ncbi:MAG: hypothetical protein KGY42_02085, partial [Desulfobacterales bacterium]|nr:hypothetical protein [Desulfobacterales bacterium]